jgi:hypothetical protein
MPFLDVVLAVVIFFDPLLPLSDYYVVHFMSILFLLLCPAHFLLLDLHRVFLAHRVLVRVDYHAQLLIIAVGTLLLLFAPPSDYRPQDRNEHGQLLLLLINQVLNDYESHAYPLVPKVVDPEGEELGPLSTAKGEEEASKVEEVEGLQEGSKGEGH